MLSEILKAATKYTTKEEFKAGNLPKYLLARRLRLLGKLFPETPTIKKKKGVFYLYNNLKVVYIGHSLTDIISEIIAKGEQVPKANNYRYFELHSSSDILVISSYLSNKNRPEFNNNFGLQRLTFKIPKIYKILGKSIKGSIKDIS